uniref:Uncharacterized protein n=1 Tax=Romanomermis culicivorax TaxID=13658 RepID=A0A915HJ26_ROMCU
MITEINRSKIYHHLVVLIFEDVSECEEANLVCFEPIINERRRRPDRRMSTRGAGNIFGFLCSERWKMNVRSNYSSIKGLNLLS